LLGAATGLALFASECGDLATMLAAAAAR
jgi:hypothetical protein